MTAWKVMICKYAVITNIRQLFKFAVGLMNLQNMYLDASHFLHCLCTQKIIIKFTIHGFATLS